MRIYCPKCRWEPMPNDVWVCDPGCSHAWNTFETGGRCPVCAKVWQETQCFACEVFSKHHDWYHDLPPVEVDALLTVIGEPLESRSVGTLD